MTPVRARGIPGPAARLSVRVHLLAGSLLAWRMSGRTFRWSSSSGCVLQSAGPLQAEPVLPAPEIAYLTGPGEDWDVRRRFPACAYGRVPLLSWLEFQGGRVFADRDVVEPVGPSVYDVDRRAIREIFHLIDELRVPLSAHEDDVSEVDL